MIFSHKNKTLLNEKEFKSERELHDFVSKNCEQFFGVNVIDDEYPISFFDNESNKQLEGRIDTLGVDNDGVPVIIEYKVGKSSNIINQALYYLDWLKTNKRTFELEVKNLNINSEIDFNNIRIICIAKVFNKYDYNACRQIAANIELYTYTNYEDIFELTPVYITNNSSKNASSSFNNNERTTLDMSEFSDDVNEMVNIIIERYKEEYSELSIKYLKHYISLSINNKLLDIIVQKNGLKVYVKNLDIHTIDEKYVDLFENETDVSHWGTCNYKYPRIGNIEEVNKFLSIIFD